MSGKEVELQGENCMEMHGMLHEIKQYDGISVADCDGTSASQASAQATGHGETKVPPVSNQRKLPRKDGSGPETRSLLVCSAFFFLASFSSRHPRSGTAAANGSRCRCGSRAQEVNSSAPTHFLSLGGWPYCRTHSSTAIPTQPVPRLACVAHLTT